MLIRVVGRIERFGLSDEDDNENAFFSTLSTVKTRIQEHVD